LGNELTGAVAGKRFAWLIAVLAAVALLTTLAQQPRPAHAGAISAVTFQAPAQAAGLTETWTVGFTTAVSVPAGGTITIGFPTSFTTSAVTIAGISTTGFGGATAASVNVSTNGTIVITTATAATGVGAGTVVVRAIANPPTNATLTTAVANTPTAGFNVATSVDTIFAAGAAPKIWTTTGAASHTSIAADGASASILTFALSTTSNNAGGGTATIRTTNGAILSVVNTGTFGTGWVLSADRLSANSPLAAAVAGPLSVTLVAPVSAGSTSVTLLVAPADVGNAALMGAVGVNFTDAAIPGPVAIVTVSSAASSMPYFGWTSVVTITARDDVGRASLRGTIVTVTVSTGTFAACPAGGPPAPICTTTIGSGPGAGAGEAKVAVTGGVVAVPMTITAAVGSVTGSATIQLTGPATSISLAAVRPDFVQAGSTLPYSATTRPAVNTTTATGSGVVVATTKDATGNPIDGAVVSYGVVPNDGGVSVENETGGAICVSRTTSSDVSFFGKSCQAIIANTIAVPGAKYTITASTTNPVTGVTYSASTTVTIGAALSAPMVAQVAAPDIAAGGVGSITATLADVKGNKIGDGQPVTATVTCGTFLAIGIGAATVSTVNGVAAFGYVAPGGPCLATLNIFVELASNSTVTVSKTVTFAVVAIPLEPGAIGAGGLLCFNYAGPTKAAADFAAFFNANVDGVNVQASTGSFSSWFRALPSTATLSSLSNGDRVCAAGVALKVFA
jgi:hypothetical protein